MNAAHTRGEWTVYHFVRLSDGQGEPPPTDAGLYEIEEANQEINALLRDGQGERAEEMAEANRRLIEAAPKLLVALERLQSNPNDPRAHREALDALRAAKGGAK